MELNHFSIALLENTSYVISIEHSFKLTLSSIRGPDFPRSTRLQSDMSRMSVHLII